MPHALRACLRPHQTATAAYMGWAGWKNGELLDAAENAAFDVLVTGGLSPAYQQNMSGRKIAIVSLSANNWPIIRSHAAKISAAVNAAVQGSLRGWIAAYSSGRKEDFEQARLVAYAGALSVSLFEMLEPFLQINARMRLFIGR